MKPVWPTGVSAILLLAAAMARADEPKWIRLTSANFELLTPAGERRGRDAILHFEQVHSFFLQVTGSRKTWSTPVRIIGFRSRKEYEPYRPNEFAAAFYLPGPACDYIVMGGIGQDFCPGAVHEYVHLRVKHTGLDLPVWLNEGLAVLYESLRPIGGKVQIGEIHMGRYQVLLDKKWLPLETLTAVDHSSEHYNEKDRASLFYAQSWALVHMLTLSDQYRSRFTDLIAAIASKKPAAEAFEQVYGKSIPQVEEELRQYMGRNRFNAAVFDVKLEKAAEQPEVRPATALEVGLVLADILAQTRGKEEAARQAYGKLLESNPQCWQAAEGLGYLAWRLQQMDEARRQMARAVQLGSTNAKMYYEYAMLGPAGGNQEERARLLRKAVELQPDHREARLHLGYALLGLDQYKDAREQLLAIKEVTREQAPHYFRALAWANLRLGLKDEAKKAAEGARKWSKTPEDTAWVENLLQQLEYMEAAQARAARQAREREQGLAATPLFGSDAPEPEQAGQRGDQAEPSNAPAAHTRRRGRRQRV